MKRLALGLLLLFPAACVMPRSVAFGQTAAAVGASNAEVGASIGGQYTQFTDNGSGGTSTGGNPSFFAFPAPEGNVQYGFSDSIGLNLHMSAAGLQPGVKFTLLDGPVKLAVLPEVGLGLQIGSTPGTTGSSSSNGTDFEFLAGLKAILSVNSFYVGAGYDFTYANEATTLFATGTGSSTTTTLTSHSAAAAIGYEFAVGSLRIRPELAFLYSPGFTGTSSGSTTSTTVDGHVIFYPNVTLALAGPARSAAPAAAP